MSKELELEIIYKSINESLTARGHQIRQIRKKTIILGESYKVAFAALKEIKNNLGKVCPEYEICEHESCRSSYNAWAIASETLEKIEEIKQNEKS